MKKIQMVDLKSQYEKIKTTVDASIQEVLDTNTYINGPLVQQFQKNLENYLGAKHVIPCANGTDALQIAMMGLDLKPGDEVITADFTFAATVEVIALLQLTPVLVDVSSPIPSWQFATHRYRLHMESRVSRLNSALNRLEIGEPKVRLCKYLFLKLPE